MELLLPMVQAQDPYSTLESAAMALSMHLVDARTIVSFLLLALMKGMLASDATLDPVSRTLFIKLLINLSLALI